MYSGNSNLCLFASVCYPFRWLKCLYQRSLYILSANNNLSIFPVQRQEKSLLSPCKETMSRCVEHVFVQISPTVLPVLFNSWVSRSFPEAIVKNKSGQFQIWNLHYLRVKYTKLRKISTNCSTTSCNYVKGWAKVQWKRACQVCCCCFNHKMAYRVGEQLYGIPRPWFGIDWKE